MTADSKALWVAGAGIVATAGFAASAFIQSLLRSDHELLADPISALAAGPYGWVQNVTFAVAGVLLVVFAAGIHVAVLPGRTGILGPLFIALFGMGMLGATTFPAADATGPFDAEQVPAAHTVSAVVAFLSAGLGALLLSWRLAADERWRGLAGYSRAVGIAIIVLFVGGGMLVRPVEAPLHDWLGLWQWVLIVIWFSCVIALGVRLLRATRGRLGLRRATVPT